MDVVARGYHVILHRETRIGSWNQLYETVTPPS